jgi:MFS family permease
VTAPPRFDGWRMVRVAFLVDFIAVGFFFYSFGIFYPYIDADFEGSSVGVAAGISVANFVGGAFAPFIGRALDRYPIKRIMIAGALAVSLGFACLSRTTTYLQYYLVLGTLFAFGLGMMGGMASAKLVANWFVLRRGMALGIATMGVSLSGLVMPPVATWLVSELGWRGGFLVYAGGILAIVVPVVALFVVSRPEDLGQHPDGADRDLLSAGASTERSWNAGQLLRARNFWLIAIPFAMVFSSLSAILIHLPRYAADLGIEGYHAAWVLSMAAGAGVLGKVVFGRLVDATDPRVAVFASFGAQIAGILVIMQGGGYAELLSGSAIFGFGMGGIVPLQGALTGRAFGRISFGEVMGWMRPVQMPIHALGIPLAAWIRDTTGSFDLMWQIFLWVYVAGAIIFGALRLAPETRSDGETGLA